METRTGFISLMTSFSGEAFGYMRTGIYLLCLLFQEGPN
jgi:hypothetical protein